MSAVLKKPKPQEKYFIYTYERSVNIGRDAWAYNQKERGKDVTITTQSGLNNLLRSALRDNKECIVVIHAHGASPSIQTEGQQSIYTKNVKQIDEDDYKTTKDYDDAYMQTHEAARMTGAVFADYLIDKQQLPLEVKELRFLACSTDSFAKDVAKRLGERGYPNIKVTGYKGEFSIYQGTNGEPLAGLDPDSIPELYNEEGKINWNKLTEEIQEKYSADKHEARFNSSAYFAQKEEEDIKQSLLSSSPPITSDYVPTVASPPTSSSNSSEPSASASSSTDSSEEERVRRGREEGRVAAEAAVAKEKIERELQQAARRTQEERDRDRSASPEKPKSDDDGSPLRSRSPSPRPKSSS